MAGNTGSGSSTASWVLPIVTALAGAYASREEAKQNNKPKTTTQVETRTPYMAEQINPQLSAIVCSFANNYMQQMSKRYPGGSGFSIDPNTISAMFGGSSPMGIFGDPKAYRG